MTAPFPLAPPAAKSGMDVHRFRGEYLDRFSAIETWVVERLLQTCAANAVPQMLGPRMEELRKALAEHPDLVKNQVKVQSLLTALTPYQRLRGILAHACVHVAHEPEAGHVHIFQAPATSPDQAWQCRAVLRADELGPVLNRLKDIQNRLRQQTPDA